MFWGYVTTLPCLGHQIKVKCPHRGDFICSNRLQGDFGCLKELKTFKLTPETFKTASDKQLWRKSGMPRQF